MSFVFSSVHLSYNNADYSVAWNEAIVLILISMFGIMLELRDLVKVFKAKPKDC